MQKCPYSFLAKSRTAMTAYLLSRKGYNDNYTRFPFSWNVKAYHVECAHPKGEKINPALDAQWLAYLRDNDDIYNMCVEDAQRHYADHEWTSYPGDDQGAWNFGFYGRSGGHMCLEEWRGTNIYGRDFDLPDWLDSLMFKDLRAFYRGIVCADHDFTQRAACEEIEFMLSFQRMQWEEAQDRTMDDDARALEDSRPDMYAHA